MTTPTCNTCGTKFPGHDRCKTCGREPGASPDRAYRAAEAMRKLGVALEPLRHYSRSVEKAQDRSRRNQPSTPRRQKERSPRLDSAPRGTRVFCGTCGTLLAKLVVRVGRGQVLSHTAVRMADGRAPERGDVVACPHGHDQGGVYAAVRHERWWFVPPRVADVELRIADPLGTAEVEDMPERPAA